MDKTEKQTFGQFMASRRQKIGLTQRQLADKLFVGESAVSKWEADKRRPDLELVTKIANLFGITESELIRASVDLARVRERHEARNFRIIANLYNIIILGAFAITLLVCFICNLAVDHTLDWFFVVVFALTFSASVLFAPHLLHRHLPKALARHTPLLSIALDTLALFLMLVVIDLQNWVGWSFTIALPILAFWVAAICASTAILQYLKINWAFKTASVTALFLLVANTFHFLLLGLNIESNNPQFWHANFAKWGNEDLINSNVYLIINLALIAIIAAFSIVGFVRQRVKK